MSDYTIIKSNQVADVYAGTDVPGEFRPLSQFQTLQIRGHPVNLMDGSLDNGLAAPVSKADLTAFEAFGEEDFFDETP